MKLVKKLFKQIPIVRRHYEEKEIRHAIRICASNWYAEVKFSHGMFRYMELEDEIVKLVKHLKGGEITYEKGKA